MDQRYQPTRITHTPEEESPLSPFTSKWEYDVFLSFAGQDTRLNFTDHLHDAFIRRGVKCFRDAEGIERGQVIKQQLLQAIKDSLCAVVVLSENYANSSWCLNELQEILESRKKFGLHVFPVFYDVDPSDVRHQRESFGKALAEHEKRFEKAKDNKVQIWREALSEVSHLSGWDTRSRPETEVIRDIVEAVWKTVFSNFPSYDDDLVGIEARIVQINSLLEIKEYGTRFVGIWGMGGVGKTTLAKVVFERMSGQFEMSCFIANVRETSERQGLVSLQKYILSHLSRPQEIYEENFGQICLKRLFCNRKVLLVLDDVSHASHLENLAYPEWFGPESRVIITARDLQLLKSQGLYSIYEVKTMGEDESLELFSKKAFKKDHPEDEYLELSKTVVKYAGGVPWALYVLGSSLYGRSLIEWEESLEMMKSIPEKDIFKILKTSYLGLNDEQKTMFLDIACFFNGWKRDEVAQILKNCNFHPTIGINILIERALLIEKTTSDGETILEVHDLLQELARSIIFQESPSHIYGRSRLWNLEDIDEVLKNDQGSEAIQAIVLPYNLDREVEVHREAFSKMCNLRLLIISSELKVPKGLKCFPSGLKVIQWRQYPLKTLPIGTRLEKLVDIQMPFSKIKHWNGMQHLKNLKFIDLSNSHDLVETPDFSKIPNLEKLNLEGCSSLVAVHHSLGQLEKLVELNLSCCTSLQILPKTLEMNSLTKLDISWCNQLSVLPQFGKCVKKLAVLDARETAVTKLPESLGFLSGLRDFNLSGPRDLFLQMSCFNPTSLTMLDLSYCGINDGSIPENFGHLSSLIILRLEGNDFTYLPSGCFSNMFELLHLYLNNCERLKSLPRLPPRLIHLEASGCKSMEHLSSAGMWNIVSPLDHEYRLRTNYEKRVLQPIQSGYVPEADFLAIMPKSEPPSWFPNRTSFLKRSSFLNGPLEYELVVDMPPYFRTSKWCGLAVCLQVQGMPSSCAKYVISWGCKAPEDSHFSEEWANEISIGNAWDPHLYVMLLDFNEKTCWQHLRGNNNRLHIKLSFTYEDSRALNLVCRWRALCKEEMQEWSNDTIDINKITEEGSSTVSSSDGSRRRQNQETRNPLLAWREQLFLTVMISCLFWFLSFVLMK
ncbi:hypothetical protein QN277_016608 [Acacia crassicarpa]|uniref:TIR domain-containing protein n=1 Tax=Acacia crassicarpa TaxID=499986 RepID=A0AAE1TBR3_9FABA|nr:hypothetical protein QN277_016608 [Acacia crassicarpa]